MSSWTSSSIFSLQVQPLLGVTSPSSHSISVQPSWAVQLDSLTLSIHSGHTATSGLLEPMPGSRDRCNKAGTSSSLTPLGSPPSRGFPSTRGRRRVQSTDVFTSQSDLAPEAGNFPPRSNHDSGTTTPSSGLSMLDHREAPLADSNQSRYPNTVQNPFPQVSGGGSLAREDAQTQAVERRTKPAPRPPPPRLLPGLLDPVCIFSGEMALKKGDSRRASGRPQKGHRPNRVHSRPRDPGDFGEPVPSRAVTTLTEFDLGQSPALGGFLRFLTLGSRTSPSSFRQTAQPVRLWGLGSGFPRGVRWARVRRLWPMSAFRWRRRELG